MNHTGCFFTAEGMERADAAVMVCAQSTIYESLKGYGDGVQIRCVSLAYVD